jgi:hypothetical protein
MVETGDKSMPWYNNIFSRRNNSAAEGYRVASNWLATSSLSAFGYLAKQTIDLLQRPSDQELSMHTHLLYAGTMLTGAAAILTAAWCRHKSHTASTEYTVDFTQSLRTPTALHTPLTDDVEANAERKNQDSHQPPVSHSDQGESIELTAM